MTTFKILKAKQLEKLSDADYKKYIDKLRKHTNWIK